MLEGVLLEKNTYCSAQKLRSSILARSLRKTFVGKWKGREIQNVRSESERVLKGQSYGSAEVLVRNDKLNSAFAKHNSSSMTSKSYRSSALLYMYYLTLYYYANSLQ